MPKVTLLCKTHKLISPKERAATSASRYESKPMTKDEIDKRIKELNVKKGKRNARA